MEHTKNTKAQDNALRDYPGAAINDADHNKVSDKMVEDRTKAQNCNPRGSEYQKP